MFLVLLCTALKSRVSRYGELYKAIATPRENVFYCSFGGSVLFLFLWLLSRTGRGVRSVVFDGVAWHGLMLSSLSECVLQQIQHYGDV